MTTMPRTLEVLTVMIWLRLDIALCVEFDDFMYW
jgi:hypothetical protein